MDVRIIKSGSSGNCVTVDDRLIIDAGFCPDVVPKGSALLLTHAHTDHTKALQRFEGIPIYAGRATSEAIAQKWPFLAVNILECEDDGLPNPTYRLPYDATPGDEYFVRPINVKHDVPCIGFDITHDGERILYATDFNAFREEIDVRDYTALYLECNNTLTPEDFADLYFTEEKPKDEFHRRKSYHNHCNVGYLRMLFERAGFSEDNPCDIPLTLLHKSTYYYHAHPEELVKLCKIANVQNPLL